MKCQLDVRRNVSNHLCQTGQPRFIHARRLPRYPFCMYKARVRSGKSHQYPLRNAWNYLCSILPLKYEVQNLHLDTFISTSRRVTENNVCFQLDTRLFLKFNDPFTFSVPCVINFTRGDVKPSTIVNVFCNGKQEINVKQIHAKFKKKTCKQIATPSVVVLVRLDKFHNPTTTNDMKKNQNIFKANYELSLLTVIVLCKITTFVKSSVYFAKCANFLRAYDISELNVNAE